MKKLMIAACAVAFAAAAQAASVNWTSEDYLMGVNKADLKGNGSVAAGSYDFSMSSDVLSYVLSVYDGVTLVGSANGTIEYSFMGNPEIYNIAIEGSPDAWTPGKSYDYVIEITGAQSDMAAYKDDNWDYSAATLSATLNGSFTGEVGTPTIETGVPSSWTVSGATPVEGPEPTPEPTSAMLMLLGVAGLALRRKQK